MRFTFGWMVVTAAVALLPPVALADTVALGYVSFDVLIPAAPGHPGVNTFTVANFTGDPSLGGNDLPPTFPVLTSVTFLSSSLTLVSGATSQVFDLGDLGPGFYNPPTDFPDTDSFTSATFSATLDTTTFQLDSGGTFNASSNQISVALLPSTGNELIAGAGPQLITVSSASPVPEPSEFWMLSIVAVWLAFRYYKAPGRVN